ATSRQRRDHGLRPSTPTSHRLPFVTADFPGLFPELSAPKSELSVSDSGASLLHGTLRVTIAQPSPFSTPGGPKCGSLMNPHCLLSRTSTVQFTMLGRLIDAG